MFRLDSYEILAEDARETVVADPDQVLRIHTATAAMSPQERTRFGKELLVNIDTLDINFAGLALRREILIGKNPLHSGDVVMTREPRMEYLERPPLFDGGTDIDENIFGILSEQDGIRKSLGAIASIGVKMSGFNGLVPDTDKIKVALRGNYDQPHIVIGGLLIDRLADETEFEKNVSRLHALNRLVQIKNISTYRP